jgi:hypothetical protein
MGNVVLLGDSIFDNRAYVNGPDVIKQLEESLPNGYGATLRARDGSLIADIRNQIENLPKDTSHLIVSVGGNNALGFLDLFDHNVAKVSEALMELSNGGDAFHQEYKGMLKSVLALNIPTAICTIYYPQFPNETLQKISIAALTIFNDSIIREAFLNSLPLIDLRLVCNSPLDYANPIEPSIAGGEKISKAIVNVITKHNFKKKSMSVYI